MRRTELSAKLVRAAKGVKLLSALSWPSGEAEAFLRRWRAGELRPPPPVTPPSSKSGEALDALIAACDRADPVQRFIARTAQSYRSAVSLLDNAGTPTFHRISRELYGGADGLLGGSNLCHREAAERLLESTKALTDATADEDSCCLSAEHVAEQLHARWDGFFERPIRIVVDANLAAKAAASATRVRLRAGACFSEEDIAQLSVHEIGVHALTARNGRAQSVGALSLGAPRTTATQEGLATFAELVTGSIDLARLRRLALRIRAIALAEDGADFVQLFEALLEAGEPPTEAVRTTMRVFRGADLRGRHVFTKDVVYLKGLFAVHTFMRKAIAEHRPELISRLFVGRLTLSDTLDLEEAFADGTVAAARFVPHWAERLPRLAGFLAFSALIDHIDLEAVELEHA